MDLTTVTELRAGTGPTIDDLPAWQPGDAWLAGGTWLFSQEQPGTTRLLDLTTLGWPAFELDDAGDPGLVIGATCTIAELYALGRALPDPRWTVGPLIRQCCEAYLASFKIWNVATVGGNLGNALPAGPMISLTAALGGVCTIWQTQQTQQTQQTRQLSVVELITGDGRHALAPGEVIRSVTLPGHALRSRSAFRRESLTTLGRSAALLIGRQGEDGCTLTVTASTVRPIQLTFAEVPTQDALRAELESAIAPELFHDDVHGLPAWRRHLTFRLAEEIRQELADAPGGLDE